MFTSNFLGDPTYRASDQYYNSISLSIIKIFNAIGEKMQFPNSDLQLSGYPINQLAEAFDLTNEMGMNLLHMAVNTGHDYYVMAICEQDEMIKQMDAYRGRPLLSSKPAYLSSSLNPTIKSWQKPVEYARAIMADPFADPQYKKILGYLINKPVDNAGNTLLHIAFRNRQWNEAESYIYVFNADVLVKNNNNDTQLDIAMQNKIAEVKPDFFKKILKKINRAKTAELSYALLGNNEAVINHYLSLPVQQLAPIFLDSHDFDLGLGHGDLKGKITFLHNAVTGDRLNLAEKICNIDEAIQREHGQIPLLSTVGWHKALTPLQTAIALPFRKSNSSAIIHYLIDKPIDVFGNTILHDAVKRNDFPEVKRLVDNFHAGIATRNYSGDTPLDLARKWFHDPNHPICRFLLDKQAGEKAPLLNAPQPELMAQDPTDLYQQRIVAIHQEFARHLTERYIDYVDDFTRQATSDYTAHPSSAQTNADNNPKRIPMTKTRGPHEKLPIYCEFYSHHSVVQLRYYYPDNCFIHQAIETLKSAFESQLPFGTIQVEIKRGKGALRNEFTLSQIKKYSPAKPQQQPRDLASTHLQEVKQTSFTSSLSPSIVTLICSFAAMPVSSEPLPVLSATPSMMSNSLLEDRLRLASMTQREVLMDYLAISISVKIVNEIIANYIFWIGSEDRKTVAECLKNSTIPFDELKQTAKQTPMKGCYDLLPSPNPVVLSTTTIDLPRSTRTQHSSSSLSMDPSISLMGLDRESRRSDEHPMYDEFVGATESNSLSLMSQQPPRISNSSSLMSSQSPRTSNSSSLMSPQPSRLQSPTATNLTNAVNSHALSMSSSLSIASLHSPSSASSLSSAPSWSRRSPSAEPVSFWGSLRPETDNGAPNARGSSLKPAAKKR